MSDYKLTLQSHNSDLQELINMANELPDKVEGVQLNFEVVGGLEQPTNPTENMIWVNTDVGINGWKFSATDPSNIMIHCSLGVDKKYLNSSGSYTTNSSWRITDYTLLPSNTTKIKTVFSASTSSGRYHAFYDVDKNLISTVARKNGTNSYAIPEGAVYVRMTVHTDDKMDFVATLEIDNGMVWITTGTYSSVEFNALKKNGIQVYPVSAKQYVSGAWVDKTSKSYQGGEWAELINKLWIIKDGNLQTNVVSGFNVGTGDSGQGSISFENGYIQVSTPNGSYARHTSNETIPTKEYSKLFIEYESMNGAGGNGEQFALDYDTCLLQSDGDLVRSVGCVDISAIDTDCTFSLIARAWAYGAPTTNKYYNLWLE